MEVESVMYKRNPKHPTVFCGSNGEVFSLKSSKFLKMQLDRKGYSQFSIGRKTYRAHRVVAETFFGASDLQIDHINGIKTDNRINNLEYVTNRENFDRSVSSGLRTWEKVKGDNNKNRKISSKEVLEILALKPSLPDEYTNLAIKYNVSESTVRDIMKGRSWKSIPRS